MIIGLSGKKRSGKNTVANGLETRLHWAYPNSFIAQMAFGDALKDICMQLFSLTWEQCYGEDKDTLTKIQWSRIPGIRGISGHLTARELLQVFGTNIVRSMNPDAWTEALITRIREFNPTFTLVTDVRFPNEVKAIQKEGGFVLRLTRQVENDQHESERALDTYKGFDGVIANQSMPIDYQEELAWQYVKEWLETSGPNDQ
jgi:hypothetical protein